MHSPVTPKTLEPMSEPLSDRESFENAYYYFVVALKDLAAPANEQAVSYGSSDESAAWELKHDVSLGMYLFNSPSCSLSKLQQEKMADLVNRLREVPDVGFDNASWIPVRQEAAELLGLLEPATRANMTYFSNGEE